DRVYADYVARRDAVIEGLHAHVGSLEALEQDLNNRLQHVESQLAEREDAHAEGILRTAVGEFDNERWEATRQDVEASIAQLEQDRQALMTEGDDVRSLLTSARPTPVEPEPEPEPLVVPSVPDVATELVSANVASAIAHADPALVEHTIDLNAEGEPAPAAETPDEPAHHAEMHHAEAHHEPTPMAEARPTVVDALITTDPYLRAVRRNAEAAADIESAFAVSDEEFQPIAGPQQNASDPFTVDNATPAAAVDRDRDREADAAIDALGRESGVHLPNALDDIDVFGESLRTPRANSSDYVVPRSNNDPYAPRAHAADVPTAATPSSTAPKVDAFDDLAFLRSVTESGSASSPTSTRANGVSEQAKTLRCTECGTMNFPTEWYCERCGGELATF
ncbi:MAG: Ran-binding zinc finger domain-containing protein, partial [Gemmatimonadaceae bacterium]